VGDVQGARSQAELQRSAYRRTLEQSLKADPEARALIAKKIDDAIAETGVGVALTDAEMAELATLSVGLYVEEVPQQEIDRRIDEAVRKMLTKGASPGARHDDGARYRWPFEGDTSRELIDGSWTDPRLRPRSAHTFRLPVGTPIVAARDGVVTRVVDGHTQGGLQRSFLPKSNTVMIAHSDGSVGYYAHMNPGIRVAEGQQVRVGDVLAESGETGYVEQPQLLFVVFRFTEDLEPRSVDIRFDDGSSAGVSPVVGAYYGGAPAQ
jgi:murein DD-endopeptidase MepM/ murein hydrolase activator NlpD